MDSSHRELSRILHSVQNISASNHFFRERDQNNSEARRLPWTCPCSLFPEKRRPYRAHSPPYCQAMNTQDQYSHNHAHKLSTAVDEHHQYDSHGDTWLHRLMAMNQTPSELILRLFDQLEWCAAITEVPTLDSVRPPQKVDAAHGATEKTSSHRSAGWWRWKGGSSFDSSKNLHRLLESQTNDDRHHYQGCSQCAAHGWPVSNHYGVTALHVAVHRNSWQVDQVVEALLTQCPRLASLAMANGTYPLHVLTGHNLTVHPAVFQRLLQADPTVAAQTDAHGDTPLSLLWKNVLRFRWARQWEMDNQRPEDYSAGDPSWMTVIAPDQFLRFSLLLIQASATTAQERERCLFGPDDSHDTKSNELTKTELSLPELFSQLGWYRLCQTPCCPPLLIRMLLEEETTMVQEDLHRIPDKALLVHGEEDGRLPLHLAARAPVVRLDFLPEAVVARMEPVVLLVLRAAPSAAQRPDAQGRYPLHEAVLNRSFWLRPTRVEKTLRLSPALPPMAVILPAVVQAAPEVLMVPDPIEHLAPALLLATSCRPWTDDDDHAAEELSLLYDLMRADPAAIMWCGV